MNTIQERDGLRRTVISFLKQREYVYQGLKDARALSIVGSLKLKFNLIQDYDYWRHAREVANNSVLFIAILPSQCGKHAKIRLNMLELMIECAKISKIPRHIYINQSKTQIAT